MSEPARIEWWDATLGTVFTAGGEPFTLTRRADGVYLTLEDDIGPLSDDAAIIAVAELIARLIAGSVATSDLIAALRGWGPPLS